MPRVEVEMTENVRNWISMLSEKNDYIKVNCYLMLSVFKQLVKVESGRISILEQSSFTNFLLTKREHD